MAARSRPLAIIAACSLLLFLIVWGGYRLLIAAPLSGIEAERLSPAELAAWEKDRALVRAQPLFPPPPPAPEGVQVDAAPVLGRYVRAGQEPPMEQTWWNGETRIRSTGAEELDRWLTEPGSMISGDFSLLDQLQQFQWWESSAYGAYARELAKDPQADFSSMPLPYYLPLTDLAAARLADGLRRPDQLLPALQQARHLAALIHSDESLIASMVALSIADMERRAADEGVRLGHLIRAGDGSVLRPPDPAAPSALAAINNWMPPTDAQIEAHRRVMLAWTGIVQTPGGPLPERGDQEFGFCAAVGEASLVSGMLRRLQLDAWPLEEDFSERLDQIARGLEVPGCRLPVERRKWEEGVRSFLSPIPYYRSVQAATLLSIASPDLNPYN